MNGKKIIGLALILFALSQLRQEKGSTGGGSSPGAGTADLSDQQTSAS